MREFVIVAVVVVGIEVVGQLIVCIYAVVVGSEVIDYDY